MMNQSKPEPGGKAERSATEKIPAKISDYIKQHFREGFLTDIKPMNDRSRQKFYMVDVSHENSLHHLKFNSEGTLVQTDTEPLMELFDEDEITEED